MEFLWFCFQVYRACDRNQNSIIILMVFSDSGTKYRIPVGKLVCSYKNAVLWTKPVVMAGSGSNYDLINVSGPLTVETILRTLQQRFNDGHCYVSVSHVI